MATLRNPVIEAGLLELGGDGRRRLGYPGFEDAGFCAGPGGASGREGSQNGATLGAVGWRTRAVTTVPTPTWLPPSLASCGHAAPATNGNWHGHRPTPATISGRPRWRGVSTRPKPG
jgi:hypothetical protein